MAYAEVDKWIDELPEKTIPGKQNHLSDTANKNRHWKRREAGRIQPIPNEGFGKDVTT